MLSVLACVHSSARSRASSLAAGLSHARRCASPGGATEHHRPGRRRDRPADPRPDRGSGVPDAAEVRRPGVNVGHLRLARWSTSARSTASTRRPSSCRPATCGGGSASPAPATPAGPPPRSSAATVGAPTMLGPTGVLSQPDSPPLISWTSRSRGPGATTCSSARTRTSPTRPRSSTTRRPDHVSDQPGPVGAEHLLRAGAGRPGHRHLHRITRSAASYTIEGLAAATGSARLSSGVVTDAVLDWKPVPGRRDVPDADRRRQQLRLTGVDQ